MTWLPGDNPKFGFTGRALVGRMRRTPSIWFKFTMLVAGAFHINTVTVTVLHPKKIWYISEIQMHMIAPYTTNFSSKVIFISP
jgi:hypothetical protein